MLEIVQITLAEANKDGQGGIILEVDMKEFVKERDEALLSLDETKIRAYLRKYGVDYEPENEMVWWAGIHKAILGILSASTEQVERSKNWLEDHGFLPEFL